MSQIVDSASAAGDAPGIGGDAPGIGGDAPGIGGDAPGIGGDAGQTGGGRAGKIRPFRKRSVEWLKKEAKNRGFSGYSKMKKDELVDMLKGSKPPRRSV